MAGPSLAAGGRHGVLDRDPPVLAQAQAAPLTMTDGSTGSDSVLVTDRLALVQTRRDHHDAAAAATVTRACGMRPGPGSHGQAP